LHCARSEPVCASRRVACLMCSARCHGRAVGCLRALACLRVPAADWLGACRPGEACQLTLALGGGGVAGYSHDASTAMRSRSAHHHSPRARGAAAPFILTPCAVATGQHAFGYLVPGRPPQYSDSFQQVEAASWRIDIENSQQIRDVAVFLTQVQRGSDAQMRVLTRACG
jgi:hypothetical protein